MGKLTYLRVTKRRWYDEFGGFANSRCFRKAGKFGHWGYYVRVD